MNLLIVGDSFAADWTVKYPKGKGWPNLLAEHHLVTNLAQAGIGEYKIYQQVKSVCNLGDYDAVVISHTSPYRIHTRNHPVHCCDILHKNADLMMNDICYHAAKIGNWLNLSLWSAKRFFIDHFDSDYQEQIHFLLKDRIHQTLSGLPCIVINNFPCVDNNIQGGEIVIDFSNLAQQQPGLYNHLNEAGNNTVFHTLQQTLDELR